jgi:hypothetical protein
MCDVGPFYTKPEYESSCAGPPAYPKGTCLPPLGCVGAPVYTRQCVTVTTTDGVVVTTPMPLLPELPVGRLVSMLGGVDAAELGGLPVGTDQASFTEFTTVEMYRDPVDVLKHQLFVTNLESAGNLPNGFKNRQNTAITNALNGSTNVSGASTRGQTVIQGDNTDIIPSLLTILNNSTATQRALVTNVPSVITRRRAIAAFNNNAGGAGVRPVNPFYTPSLRLM